MQNLAPAKLIWSSLPATWWPGYDPYGMHCHHQDQISSQYPEGCSSTVLRRYFAPVNLISMPNVRSNAIMDDWKNTEKQGGHCRCRLTKTWSEVIHFSCLALGVTDTHPSERRSWSGALRTVLCNRDYSSSVKLSYHYDDDLTLNQHNIQISHPSSQPKFQHFLRPPPLTIIRNAQSWWTWSSVGNCGFVWLQTATLHIPLKAAIDSLLSTWRTQLWPFDACPCEPALWYHTSIWNNLRVLMPKC